MLKLVARLFRSPTIGSTADWTSLLKDAWPYILSYGAALTAAFGWLATQIDPIVRLGWAAVFAFGVVVACLVALAVSLSALAFQAFKRPKAQEPAELAEVKQAQIVSPVAVGSKQYLDAALIAGGTANRPPEYRARFMRNGRDGAFYVEYSAFAGGFGGGWTQPRVLLVLEKERFVEGEQVSIPIFGEVDTPEGKRWHFQPKIISERGFPRDMLGRVHNYRGRIRFVSSDDQAENCYFVALTNDLSDIPIVIGEHMFSHIQEWEGDPVRHSNSRSLFR